MFDIRTPEGENVMIESNNNLKILYMFVLICAVCIIAESNPILKGLRNSFSLLVIGFIAKLFDSN